MNENTREIRSGYTRVTSVLEPFSGLGNIDPLVLHNAAERGTKVHRYCELHAMGEYFPWPDEEISPYLESFVRWHDEIVEEIVYLELRLYNDILRLTGQIDMVAKLKGSKDVCIIDYKTPQTESKTWPLQLAAYQRLFNCTEDTKGRIKAQRRIALRLSKKGDFPVVHEYTDFGRDWGLYEGILNAWRYFNGV